MIEFSSIDDYELYISLIVNPIVKKHLRTIEGLDQQQNIIIIPSYWYGSNLYVFPMGTPMMLMNTNPMINLPMLLWNPMTYFMLNGVLPSIQTTQILMTIHVSVNT